ncbi:hypothetical protein AFCDBAGC_0708 [Methylobacterium cerastii]|uniref:Uncharacterized protein n=1 Tax=Methylobacterium cerastii TaxID=932741 RepID=A0ABQ4QCP6_9HYPH|nr:MULTISPECIES: hypothetical protein [Methylobacterium]TXM67427.1 hypothetical protein FV229_10165 [Methylobacterium sp. WL120]TXM92868.1 hypothetical protein FV219_19885 [Methylobacterium sp. WL122]TXN80213.1 hypothetical protein FV234_17735 [Methylobacterium sp. WL8]GJD42866.1 hypothetical protein AFCDBAGC_0708 [Methylobacterium cerastii]
MDAIYHSLETSLLAFGFALSVAAFALLASPPAASPRFLRPPFADASAGSILLPMLTVDVPRNAN